MQEIELEKDLTWVSNRAVKQKTAKAKGAVSKKETTPKSREGKTAAGKKPKADTADEASSETGGTYFGPEAPQKSREKIYHLNGHDVVVSNSKKLYFPESGFTKQDIANYYLQMAPFILPYLKDRPFVLSRYPNGIYEDSFYQKDITGPVPAFVETLPVYSESNEKDIHYLICQNEETLIYLANLGCIELHCWNSRKQHLENPDYMVIDLDPEDIGFEKVIETALVVKEVLDEAGASNFCKTSGATGLHIYVPLGAKYDYEIVREFGHLVAMLVHRRIPHFTSIERSPKKRQKKVYLDYLQNRFGQTLVAPYSVRPREGAPVSTPLYWEEVKKGLNPASFTIRTIQSRVEEMGDLWKPVYGKGIDLMTCLTHIQER
jgi:bifunctional non-homologous end joining protein LigD